MNKGILVDRKVVIENDLLKWAKWFEESIDQRIVAKTYIGDVRISTVFMGLDHAFGEGKPMWFETMIFGDKTFEDYQERYSTWEEAEVGHAIAVEGVRKQHE